MACPPSRRRGSARGRPRRRARTCDDGRALEDARAALRRYKTLRDKGAAADEVVLLWRRATCRLTSSNRSARPPPGSPDAALGFDRGEFPPVAFGASGLPTASAARFDDSVH